MMASWRTLGIPITALLLTTLACGGASGGFEAGRNEAGGAFVQSIERPGGEPILVLMPNLPQAKEIWRGMSDELRAEYSVIAYEVTADTSAKDVAKEIDRIKPRCVVLMNNPTVKLYRTFQETRPGTTFPPAVVVMASFLEEQYQHIENATGIAYEVPGVTLFTNFRSLVSTPIRRVGVIYRPVLKPYVARQRHLAEREQIETVGEAVSAEPSVKELQGALRRLQRDAKVDLLWVLNDNALLTPELVAGAWLPALEGAGHAPVIVGTPALLSGEGAFGTFAMIPDHSALGVQSANLVFQIADNNWRVAEVGVQLPLSIRTVVNMQQAKKNLALRDGALQGVDHVAR
jgi:hypothetical protein